jgi:hypothetical protein
MEIILLNVSNCNLQNYLINFIIVVIYMKFIEKEHKIESVSCLHVVSQSVTVVLIFFWSFGWAVR